jgi:glutathione S-transferase
MKKNYLVIGDYNLSSWSLRPWLVLKNSQLPIKVEQILLDRPTTAQQIKKYSPSGRVPVLHYGGVRIWDSLAICEFLAELAPEKKLWPEDPMHRAIARSLVCEMHSGFQSLRSQLSMDINLRMNINHLNSSTVEDIKRIIHIWDQSIQNNGGPYLFGHFTIADAFFAPVVMRFNSYGIKVENKNAIAYMQTIRSNKYMKEWIANAKRERPYRPSFK